MVASRDVCREPRSTTLSVKGMILRGFGGLALIVCIAAVSCPAQGQEASRRLGTNLDAVTDYSPQVPFTNIFLSSRDWFTQCLAGVDPGCASSNAWDTGESALIDLDSDGWVRSLPSPGAAPLFTSVATFWDLPPEFPSGRYVVLYDGQGVIEYGIGATKLPELSTRGRDVVTVDISRGGILLRITETNTLGDGDYIRSIRFVAEADERGLLTNRFSGAFLKRLQPYQALRFMDWMRTNDSVVSTWGGRSQQSDARFSTAKGVPAEIMVELSNTTEKAPWFTIPHQATDEYVRNFATLVRESLLSTLPIYVEYSNEIWNAGFSQGGWVEAQGVTEWPASLESRFTKRMNWHGKRSAHVCEIWKSVFAASPERVTCVLASQAANSWTAQEALSCPLWSEAPCSGHGIGALAIAPYMGDYLGQEENATQVARWGASASGLSKLFAELQSGGELSGGATGGAVAQSFGWIEANRTVADAFGVALLSYEGGQHLVGVGSASHNSTLTSLFTQANREERMGAVYTAYLQGWESRGGGLFMHFTDTSSYSRYGSWGALELIGQTASAKYNALWTYAFGTQPPVPLPSTPLPTPPPTVIPSKTIRASKRGRGEIVSSPGGIRCGSRCSATFSQTRKVILKSRPASRYRFVGWTGACQHSRRVCVVTLPYAGNVTATFSKRK